MLKNMIFPKVKIFEAIASLDKIDKKLLVILDDDGKILGTLSDGDIRRGILNGVSLEEPVCEIMNTDPLIASIDGNLDRHILKAEERKIFYIPIVDHLGKFADLLSLKEIKERIYADYSVFILAGGLGARLKELTKKTPKPMLHVKDKPMLEKLILDFKQQGLKKFYISVNYLKDVIKNHFADGRRLDVDITYIEEEQRLGTAGPMSLLPDSISEKGLIVINADIAIKVDYRSILRYHYNRQNSITLCVKEKQYEVPYGVVKFEQDSLIRIEEKPVTSYFINAGIYVIERDLLARLPKNIFFDMPDFINLVKSKGERVGIYPLHEEWIDIGLPEHYKQVNVESAETEDEAGKV